MTEQIDNIPSVLLAALASFWTTILGFMPNVLATFLVLVLGLLLARFSKIVVERLLRWINFNSLVQRTGLEELFDGSEYNFTISGIISATVYWLVILLMITSIADLLRLQIIYDLFERFVIYLPNILVAVAILIAGTIFARIVNRYVFNLAKAQKVGMDMALRAGIAVEYIILIVVWFLALQQLHVNVDLLLVIIGITFGSVGLAFGLAFGLAGRKQAAKFLDKLEGHLERGIDSD